DTLAKQRYCMTTKKTTGGGCFFGRNKVSLKQTNKAQFEAILIAEIWAFFVKLVLCEVSNIYLNKLLMRIQMKSKPISITRDKTKMLLISPVFIKKPILSFININNEAIIIQAISAGNGSPNSDNTN